MQYWWDGEEWVMRGDKNIFSFARAPCWKRARAGTFDTMPPFFDRAPLAMAWDALEFA